MKYFNPRVTALSSINNLDLNEGDMVGLDNEAITQIKAYLKLKILTRDDLEATVHKRLCAIGINNIDTHINSFTWEFIRYPDHSVSPVSIGYPVIHSQVSKEKLGLIKFDHGETIEDYIRGSYGLFDKVLNEILNKKPTQNNEELKLDWVSCGDGGPCTC